MIYDQGRIKMIDFLKMVSVNFIILGSIHNLSVLLFVSYADNWKINKKVLLAIQIFRWITMLLIFKYFPGISIFFILLFSLTDLITLENKNRKKQRQIFSYSAFFYVMYLRPLVNNPENQSPSFFFEGLLLLLVTSFLFIYNVIKMEKHST